MKNTQLPQNLHESRKLSKVFNYFDSLQKGTGCAKYACYNGGTCIETCHGDMFYCHCTKMFRGKQCERPKGMLSAVRI